GPGAGGAERAVRRPAGSGRGRGRGGAGPSSSRAGRAVEKAPARHAGAGGVESLFEGGFRRRTVPADAVGYRPRVGHAGGLSPAARGGPRRGGDRLRGGAGLPATGRGGERG